MIILIVIGVFGTSYLLNNFLLSKYYIYKTKVQLDNIYNYSKTINLKEFEELIPQISEKYNITIIIENPNNSLNIFNQDIQLNLSRNKVNLTKFWINQNDIDLIKKGLYINKIFYQPKLQSNYFVKMFKKDGKIIILGTSMAQDQATINIVNQFNLYIILISIFMILFLVWLFTRKTIKSIENLKSLSVDIANLKFNNIEIKTGDEIEELGNSINSMSESLKKAHSDLEKKNEDLKSLISSISHEVKTPLALIKAYTIGIKDGLDDGSFSDIIIEQVDNTTNLVNSLLELSRVQRGIRKKTNFDVITVLESVLERYKLNFKNKNINLLYLKNTLNNLIINADKSQIEIVINNLISNSIKYNDGNIVIVNIENKSNNINRLSIKNKSYNLKQKHLDDIWKPFFVIEESRNKDLSGTGIGLSLVSSILIANNINYGVIIENDSIVNFYIDFKI